MSGPADVVREALAAADRDQWRRVASMISPDALKRIQQHQVGMFATMPLLELPGPGAGSLAAISYGPVSPDAARSRVPSLPGAPTLGELEAMPAEDFYVLWQGVHPRPRWWEPVMVWVWRKFVLHFEQQDRPTEVLGEVIQDERTAHVVYRISGAANEQQAEVISLIRSGETWVMRLNPMSMGVDPFQARASAMAFLKLTRPGLGLSLWGLVRATWHRFRHRSS